MYGNMYNNYLSVWLMVLGKRNLEGMCGGRRDGDKTNDFVNKKTGSLADLETMSGLQYMYRALPKDVADSWRFAECEMIVNCCSYKFNLMYYDLHIFIINNEIKITRKWLEADTRNQ